MEENMMLKRVIEFHKASFDNSFETMVMVQNQSEKIAEAMWDQSDRSSKAAQQAVSEWAAVCRASREDFKKAVDEGYAKLSALFSNGAEPRHAEMKKRDKSASSEAKQLEKQDKTKTK